ncbi:glycosyltransferase [Salisediminibacterium selenitireducens]|uniref:4,4'-diaponeurosporenoate glycosyltransferase n=1 Tax=Bacillus selenitireducens (strain ATCC 700615 / DSM 15326 / MLS10) TaxID=439292 RepID=D6XYL5_BACIE|nr:glycosyltransferase [Salisediminibacterium selenitireducens]ADH98173.1 glycosyl transferase family 2 [[Bacillus] selenitireducens MLS10]
MVYLAWITVILWGLVLIDTWIGFRRFPKLDSFRETVLSPADRSGRVSVIVAARNEEDAIYESVKSQLTSTWPGVEWILVNDRSTDATGEKMDELARQDSRIRVVHVRDLPEGWLGKNHAMHCGYEEATGSALLFTDADVMFRPHTIEGAMACKKTTGARHVTMTPEMTVKTFWTQAFVHFFLFGFSYYKRPWKANDDRSKIALGIGAFNLIDREAYEAIGTHRAIRLRPDDDLMLGVRVKAAGMRQRAIDGTGGLSVEWYPSLKEAVKGLEKNTFAGLHYSWLMVLFALSGVFVSQVLPFIGVLFHEGSARWVYLAAVVLMLIIYVKTSFAPWKKALKTFTVFPLSALIFIYTLIRAVLKTVIRGGIEWRGTFYSLKELKKQRNL